ncbi:MAG: NAD(P)/FAD-dependent oxidoreductase [Deltaproteobacteria bacterium]|nr:NAD(P)/FAD-dependent oxidoreductase [Deltaproteobacteria bacterium]
MSASRYDAIVIGAGHNGLVTAGYLARGGLRVLVLERRPVVGGACVTEEVFPGYRVSTAAYLCSLLQPRVIQDLELERFGYQILPKDPASFTPLPDGRSLFLWQDRARTVEAIAQFSAADARTYPAYEARLARLARFIEPLFLMAPPDLPPRRADDLLALGRLTWRLLRLPGGDLVGLVKLLTQSVRDYLEAWFDSEALKVTLATDGVIGSNAGPRTPGTAYVLFHHCMGGVGGVPGLWGFVRGGMGGITQALARSAQAHGAEVRTGAEVGRVLIREGRACGVVLASGEELRASVVVSNADPKRTLLGLVGRPHLPPEIARQVEAIKMEGSSLKINLAVGELPDFRACPGTRPGPHHRATIHLCPSLAYLERAWDDARQGRPSEEPMVELTIPTLYDPKLAPPGRHLLSLFVQYAPYRLAGGGSWRTLGEAYADRVLDCLAEYAPNIKGAVLHRQVLTPLDLEEEFGMTGGHIFHGEMSLDQLFSLRPLAGWARYRTPVPGLYLCGSGTHPGGGVTGAPGHNAARAILWDWRRNKV